MDWNRRHLGAVVSAVALAVLAGCTPAAAPTQTPSTSVGPPSSPVQPSTLGPTATPTPSPSATWSVEQAAAIKAVDDYSAAFDRIGADPASFTRDEMTAALEGFSGENALTSTVDFLISLKENEYRREGSVVVVWVLATEVVDDGRGDEVHVTTCRDQSAVRIVDRDGELVTSEEFAIPEYNLRQLSVRKPPGEKAFRVFGFQTIPGSCP